MVRCQHRSLAARLSSALHGAAISARGERAATKEISRPFPLLDHRRQRRSPVRIGRSSRLQQPRRPSPASSGSTTARVSAPGRSRSACSTATPACRTEGSRAAQTAPCARHERMSRELVAAIRNPIRCVPVRIVARTHSATLADTCRKAGGDLGPVGAATSRHRVWLCDRRAALLASRWSCRLGHRCRSRRTPATGSTIVPNAPNVVAAST